MATEIMNLDALPYYVFKKDGIKRYLEGRFWNQSGIQIAIVATVTEVNGRGDWAAYIGADARQASSEEDTCICATQHGCKLSEKDARHFFPEIKLSYRY